eukprot:SAG31_NODE_18323_length_640_cov_1.048059_2_plen_53_part_01
MIDALDEKTPAIECSGKQGLVMLARAPSNGLAQIRKLRKNQEGQHKSRRTPSG